MMMMVMTKFMNELFMINIIININKILTIEENIGNREKMLRQQRR